METQRLTTTGAQTELKEMAQAKDEFEAALAAKTQEATDLEGTIVALSEQHTQTAMPCRGSRNQSSESRSV